MNKIAIIIFARLNSKRLKGKVLKKIFDKYLLEIIYLRLKRKLNFPIIVNTSKNKSDDKIIKFCQKRKIHIKIVAGSSFLEYETLASNLKGKQGVTLTQATDVISSIMETTQLSIVSNGRTIYELVHMNIPSIVISQHEREETHSFACEENGFIPLGIYEHGNTEKEVLIALEKIVNDETYRHKLFDNMKPFRFNANKQRVLRKMFTLLDQPLHAGGEN